MNKNVVKRLLAKKDDAVSPVIAVILMVAITVVLVATLFVMISGMTDTEGVDPKLANNAVSAFSTNRRLTVGTYALGGANRPQVSQFSVNVEDKTSGISNSGGSILLDISSNSVNSTTHGGKTYYFVIKDLDVDVTIATSVILYTKYDSTDGFDNFAGQEWNTLTNCYFMFIDNDNDGTVSQGDIIYYYGSALGSFNNRKTILMGPGSNVLSEDDL